jgi:hypothetical protein
VTVSPLGGGTALSDDAAGGASAIVGGATGCAIAVSGAIGRVVSLAIGSGRGGVGKSRGTVSTTTAVRRIARKKRLSMNHR